MRGEGRGQRVEAYRQNDFRHFPRLRGRGLRREGRGRNGGFLCLLALVAACLICGAARAQQITPADYGAMKWRLIGPFRGGRALAAAGIAGEPNVYYFGAVDGGVWKTTDGGRVWQPLWTHEDVASIGALALAPSDPKIIYAGTGEADMRSDISFGDGVYKSTDGGETWKNVGLRATRHIGRILVDPENPNVVLVAALGRAYGPNSERGVYRSTDGGATWTKVLYKDENTGAIDLCFNPGNPHVVYAAMWNARRPPWSTYPPREGPGSGLYKSLDEGVTWTPLTGHGLPTAQIGRIGLAVSYTGSGNTVYALIQAGRESGLYRSDDGGANWQRAGHDPRITDRDWYFGHVVVDPHNANIVYVPDVALYRSEDGGKTFIPLKGAPGGDDYHALWIDPQNSQRMILASDQGTVISVDGGQTWSSWYNQATAQFYHVITDHQFPFRVYGAQQDSGSASVASRSDFGEISFRDWYPVGAGESGYIAPDPLDPHIVYGGDNYGALFRFDRRTGQAQDISPCAIARSVALGIAAERCRFTWTSPLVFSPVNPHILYFGSQFVMETTDDGESWTTISPDLTVLPGSGREPARGVVYTIAPSPLAAGEVWAGTDNGLVQLTRDGGKTWQNVTPPGLPAWSKISLIEASRYGAGIAYAAVDRHRIDDFKPYIYRTGDYGKTWSAITDGIEAPAYVHAVREDPIRQGLLYAGTETGVYVSFDDGNRWQSLQLNLPTASIRDLAIADNDLVVATHGRSFWILDDLTPLRQLNRQVADSSVYFFKPETAIRVRRDVNRDTPLPPETPVGQNPPYGAIIDYYLESAPQGEITLEILDAENQVVRKFVSGQNPPPFPQVLRFSYSWLRHPMPLTKYPGMNRFVWDLRYPSPPALFHDYSIAAVIGRNTPALPQGPLVLPGIYTARLIVGGREYDQPLSIRMDPRVTTPATGLQKQFELALRISRGLAQDQAAYREIKSLESQLKTVEGTLASNRKARQTTAALDDVGKKAADIETGPQGNGEIEGLEQLNGDLASLETTVESADAAPTVQCTTAATERLEALKSQLARWNQIKSTDLPALNERLRNYRIVPLVPSAPAASPAQE
jgi:photosystem II stability/assembly factor-like uncharacterized protein